MNMSHYLLFLEEEREDILAALQPHQMAIMSQDIVQSSNRTLKLGYNDHSELGGVPAPSIPKSGRPPSWTKCGSGGSCSSICHSKPGGPT